VDPARQLHIRERSILLQLTQDSQVDRVEFH
jgi:hypothetical protein